MFVQVVQGRVKDAAGLQKAAQLWDQNLKPNAIGYLGSTGGITEDKEFFIAARFESEEAAQANSDRPEQGEWFNEMSQNLEGEATFTNFTNVDTYLDGGSDDAGFVQVMQGKTNNPQRAAELDKQFSEVAPKARPDLIGALNLTQDDGSFTAVNYFTTEEEARKAESQEPPPEFQEAMKEWESITEEIRFIDLKEPWLFSK